MVIPEPPLEQRRDEVIARLEVIVRADERMTGLWLQGSLADGTSDRWSDVDAYVAVQDSAFHDVYSERLDVVRRLGQVLAHAETPSLRALHCLLAGPVKLDLFFEPASTIGDHARPAVRLLVDKHAIRPRLTVGWTPSPEEVVTLVDRLFRGTFQGALWPIRLIHRGQWTTLALTELQVVNDFLVALMVVQRDPRLLFRNRISLPRLLPRAQREEIEDLGRAVIQAAAGNDAGAMLQTHLRIVDALFREGRAAYTLLNIGYPLSDSDECSIRDLYRGNGPTMWDTTQDNDSAVTAEGDG